MLNIPITNFQSFISRNVTFLWVFVYVPLKRHVNQKANLPPVVSRGHVEIINKMKSFPLSTRLTKRERTSTCLHIYSIVLRALFTYREGCSTIAPGAESLLQKLRVFWPYFSKTPS